MLFVVDRIVKRVFYFPTALCVNNDAQLQFPNEYIQAEDRNQPDKDGGDKTIFTAIFIWMTETLLFSIQMLVTAP